eukprot:TRINITY_DN21446_c0_g1_i1.p1 TRINITY_DN21446_c0_g1~~TRINITY_DN21446_c0_g1_i1.p1  ORF type:complete len:229 (+),score=47.54 TRINITY_DN21446_c0_g1_i1:75-761(+)
MSGSTLRRLLAESPRIELFEQALSDEQCDALRELAKKRLDVANTDSAGMRSSSLYLNSEEDLKDPLLQQVAEIAAKAAGLELACTEAVALTRYSGPSQLYDWHYDDVYLDRVATWIGYLSSVSAGGETAFPLVDPTPLTAKPQPVSEFRPEQLTDWPACVTVAPTKGNALLFYSRDRQTEERDPRSLHGSLPLLPSQEEEDKWIVQVWLHARPQSGQTAIWYLETATT